MKAPHLPLITSLAGIKSSNSPFCLNLTYQLPLAVRLTAMTQSIAIQGTLTPHCPMLRFFSTSWEKGAHRCTVPRWKSGPGEPHSHRERLLEEQPVQLRAVPLHAHGGLPRLPHHRGGGLWRRLLPPRQRGALVRRVLSRELWIWRAVQVSLPDMHLHLLNQPIVSRSCLC